MYHLSQTEQAVQTSYMMTLGNWNDTGQYRRRCEKGEQSQRLEEHRASQSKKIPSEMEVAPRYTLFTKTV